MKQKWHFDIFKAFHTTLLRMRGFLKDVANKIFVLPQTSHFLQSTHQNITFFFYFLLLPSVPLTVVGLVVVPQTPSSCWVRTFKLSLTSFVSDLRPSKLEGSFYTVTSPTKTLQHIHMAMLNDHTLLLSFTLWAVSIRISMYISIPSAVAVAVLAPLSIYSPKCYSHSFFTLILYWH